MTSFTILTTKFEKICIRLHWFSMIWYSAYLANDYWDKVDANHNGKCGGVTHHPVRHSLVGLGYVCGRNPSVGATTTPPATGTRTNESMCYMGIHNKFMGASSVKVFSLKDVSSSKVHLRAGRGYNLLQTCSLHLGCPACIWLRPPRWLKDIQAPFVIL